MKSTGEKVPACPVRFSWSDLAGTIQEQTTVTDDEGRAQPLSRDLLPRVVEVQAMPSGGVVVAATWDTSADGVIYLSEGKRVTGLVVDAVAETPIAGAEVRWHINDSLMRTGVLGEARTGGDGLWTALMPEGHSCWIEVSAPLYMRFEFAFSVTHGAINPVLKSRLSRLDATPSFVVRVLDDRGDPESANLYASDDLWNNRDRCVTYERAEAGEVRIYPSRNWIRGIRGCLFLTSENAGPVPLLKDTQWETRKEHAPIVILRPKQTLTISVYDARDRIIANPCVFGVFVDTSATRVADGSVIPYQLEVRRQTSDGHLSIPVMAGWDAIRITARVKGYHPGEVVLLAEDSMPAISMIEKSVTLAEDDRAVQVKVVNEAQMPVEFATVSVFDKAERGGFAEGCTGDDGRASVPVMGTELLVTIEAAGYAGVEWEMTRNELNGPIDIVLVRSGHVSGRVIDDSNTPVVGVSISATWYIAAEGGGIEEGLERTDIEYPGVVSSQGRSLPARYSSNCRESGSRVATTDRDGRFEVDGVPPVGWVQPIIYQIRYVQPEQIVVPIGTQDLQINVEKQIGVVFIQTLATEASTTQVLCERVASQGTSRHGLRYKVSLGPQLNVRTQYMLPGMYRMEWQIEGQRREIMKLIDRGAETEMVEIW